MIDGVYFAIDYGVVYFSQICLVHAAKIAFISQIAKFRRIFVCNHIKKSPYLCTRIREMYEKEDFYDDGDSTRHSCID